MAGCAQQHDVLALMSGRELVRLDLQNPTPKPDNAHNTYGEPELDVTFTKASYNEATGKLTLEGFVHWLVPADAKSGEIVAWIQAGELKTYYKIRPADNPARSDAQAEQKFDAEYILKDRHFFRSESDGCFDVEISLEKPSDHLWIMAPRSNTGADEGMACSNMYHIGRLLSADLIKK